MDTNLVETSGGGAAAVWLFLELSCWVLCLAAVLLTPTILPPPHIHIAVQRVNEPPAIAVGDRSPPHVRCRAKGTLFRSSFPQGSSAGLLPRVPLSEAPAPGPVGLSFSFALRRFFTITSRQKMRQAEMAAATHPNAA
uniref:Uncharacterized protein n=1 Tax=Anopheles atroparvus TaxID=41427 RepID=A0A182INK2_ANOAO